MRLIKKLKVSNNLGLPVLLASNKLMDDKHNTRKATKMPRYTHRPTYTALFTKEFTKFNKS